MPHVVHDVEQQLVRWYDALHSGDPDAVTLLYAPDAVLLSTLGQGVKTGQPQIRKYFADEFLPRRPIGSTVTPYTRILGGIAVNSGVYKFELNKKQGSGREIVTARYTFVYQWAGTNWVIVEHHSSVMPPPPKPESEAEKAPASKKRRKAT